MSTKKVLIICGITLLLSIAAEILFVHHHAYFWWHEFIGFDIIYGFAGCAAFIVVSKFLGKVLLQRPENYYDRGEDDND